MRVHQAQFPIATMCHVLGVSGGGYYEWLRRPPSARAREDARFAERIRDVHRASYETYGAPRVHAGLRAGGLHVSKKREARLMREAGIAGVSRRRGATTTGRRAGAP